MINGRIPVGRQLGWGEESAGSGRGVGAAGAAAGGGGGPIRVKPWQGGLLRGRLIPAMTAHPIPG